MTENINIEFVTDKSGNKKAVQIPLEEWEKIKEVLKNVNNNLDMKSSLKSAFIEVQQIKNGKLPKKTLKAFLDEC